MQFSRIRIFYVKYLYHKTSNRSWVSIRSQVSTTSQGSSDVQYKPGVHLVPTYNTISHFVLNDYGKTA